MFRRDKATKINLLEPELSSHLAPSSTPAPSRRRRRIITAVVVVLIIGGTLIFTNVVIPGVRLSYSLGEEGFWTQLKHLTFSGDRTLQGEDNDRVNVLLLGIGGPGHDGPLLTDTIILVSVEPSSGRAALLSLPRDLVVPFPDGRWRKINEIYAFGETTARGHGGEAAATIVSTVSGIRIPYYVLVDFDGFRQLVDDLGGVQLSVDRTFSDPLFPANDDGVELISFTAGWQWMNGDQALKFARSRHGGNGEGSDFARARRQQKVLLALKDRIFSSRVLLNPIAVNNLVSRFQGSVITNLEPWELLTLYRLSQRINTERVTRASLDTTPAGLLAETTGADGAYLLQPRDGNYNSVQNKIARIFEESQTALEPARVEVMNGTNVTGLAAEAAHKLERLGFTVVRVKNAEQRPVVDTVIYDLSNGGKPTSLAVLRVMFKADVARSIPPWLLPSAETFDPQAITFSGPQFDSDADFVIIIGTDNSNALTSFRPGTDG